MATANSTLIYTPITRSDGASGVATLHTEKGRTLRIGGAFTALREYPRVGYEVAVDRVNQLVWVRDPTDRDPDDPGRPFSLLGA